MHKASVQQDAHSWWVPAWREVACTRREHNGNAIMLMMVEMVRPQGPQFLSGAVVVNKDGKLPQAGGHVGP